MRYTVRANRITHMFSGELTHRHWQQRWLRDQLGDQPGPSLFVFVVHARSTRSVPVLDIGTSVCSAVLAKNLFWKPTAADSTTVLVAVVVITRVKAIYIRVIAVADDLIEELSGRRQTTLAFLQFLSSAKRSHYAGVLQHSRASRVG